VDERWNHNIEYHRVIHAALDPNLASVLDVGCGDGLLAAELARRGASVTAIDRDAASIERARDSASDAGVEFVVGDFLADPFAPASFDAVVSVAAVHHMDERMAFGRMAELVRPGGTVAVVGLARSRRPKDVGWDVAGAVATRVARRRHGGYWESDAPTVWPPPTSYRDIERLAADVLPGSTFRRHLMWRYSIVWTKPVVT
jgi:2-polyprenyl-3-methyl-5-hydroxy-6-metoxy-1,4-benzoquinol methylase